ncbi:MAG: hypothetical protein JWP97_4033 [Labilithrix sp.]|nr:hypothetical protein [Labilithrix sp.]
MTPKRRRRLPLLLGRLGMATLVTAGIFACGSRTGLFGEDDGTGGTVLPDGAVIPPGREGGPGPRDGEVTDDSSLPPLDAAPRDASRLDCPDAEATLIYVVTTNYDLYSYYPTDGAFTFISKIACPSSGGATPFSMAVDRKGIAYVAYNDGTLFRVSTLTGACIGTTFQPNQQGFSTFGMGFATNAAGPTETLYVASSGNSGIGDGVLGRIDTTSFALTRIGNIVPATRGAELTGTGDGRLYGFYKRGENSPPSYIGEINPSTAAVLAETPLPSVDQGNGWAFGFWGGDFYMFTSADGVTSDVTRYRPADSSVTVVGNLPSLIVGAGVSTCAPGE